MAFWSLLGDSKKNAFSLAVPKIVYRLGAPNDFDRCAILTSLHPPQVALR
jgi:hypothetical protein